MGCLAVENNECNPRLKITLYDSNLTQQMTKVPNAAAFLSCNGQLASGANSFILRPVALTRNKSKQKLQII